MSERFYDWFFQQVDADSTLGETGLVDVENLDFLGWIVDKEGWSTEKKTKYITSIRAQLTKRQTDLIGCFTTMVKSGEVYEREEGQSEGAFLHG